MGGGMEATLFTGWIYEPHALELNEANPKMLKAIASAKKKSDKVDARMIADLLRWNLLPVKAKEDLYLNRGTNIYRRFLLGAAKLAPRWNSQLAEVYDREVKKGNKNRATLAVARKLTAYMFAVDKRDSGFIGAETTQAAWELIYIYITQYICRCSSRRVSRIRVCVIWLKSSVRRHCRCFETGGFDPNSIFCNGHIKGWCLWKQSHCLAWDSKWMSGRKW